MIDLADTKGSSFALAGRPIGVPIGQYGPFVMNSREDIEQALRDFRDGVFTD